MLRIPLAAILAALALPALAQDCADGQRAFAHGAGTTCIPENPQRIVTLHDQNGLLPLMELGVTPVASFGHVQSDGTRIFRRMEGYDTSEVEWIGSYRGPFDAEAVAAMEPDLIVAAPWPPEAPELMGGIAPVVVIDMFQQPLEDALMQFADLVGRTDRAEELRAGFEAKAAETRDALGDRLAATTVSVLTFDESGGRFYPANPTQALGMVLRALDPVRPAPERGLGSEREYRAMETVGGHEADAMLHLVYDADDGGASDSHAAFTAHPLVQAMAVTRAGQVYPLDGIAMVGSAWGKAENGLDQIATILLREDLDRDLVTE
ncbi:MULTISPECIES: ABC transporter substrate-binding protein [Paracoccaceae]|jgi:iron complex transport system substrate-binding protein|uniref:ABC transporter substrate-binding protein n=1 Tax=Rhodobacterales TaxID=204455 RepID=UPI001B29B56A|nr:ABC transporter substrate-binding protein [Boseongicola sp. H5]MBO6922473.1 ABC transporter substrate-binding protein [Roseicyclus sp.]